MDESNGIGPAPVAAPAASGQYSPMRGVTRTADGSALHREQSVRSSVAGQTVSLVLFLAALLPPIALSLVRGLAGQGSAIPYSALWPWGAVVLALVVSLRPALFPAPGPTALGTVAAAAVLLLAPSVVILVLYYRLHPVPLGAGIAGIVLYTCGTFALLLGRTETGR